MRDDYISPKRTDFMDSCPGCGGVIKLSKPASEDPLMQLYTCKNSNCDFYGANIDPAVRIYGCTVCDVDTNDFSETDDHPYCLEHMPLLTKEQQNAR